MIFDDELLPYALVGLEHRRNEIDVQIAELRTKLGIGANQPSAPTGGKGVRSAETRERMAQAQRKRWAAKGKGKSSPAATKASKKRSMSPEARERIAEAQRKRWAAVRKGK